MRNVTVAATQMACTWDLEANLDQAERLVRKAAEKGANIVLLQELFQAPYFCQDQDERHFALATEYGEVTLFNRFQELAAELGVVLPFSYFEKANNVYFNSLAVIDADGELLHNYRKTHIPNGPGYQEKQYFSPGDTGFQVWATRYGKIGVAICWDQWFPEAARAMVLKGAELLFYPTAIGSEPQAPEIDSKDHWQMAMRGHAAANVVPVIASNRIGKEVGAHSELTFYGSSFITNETGQLLHEADRVSESILLQSFDLDAINERRTGWGLFRDRRPECYRPLLSLDGSLD